MFSKLLGASLGAIIMLLVLSAFGVFAGAVTWLLALMLIAVIIPLLVTPFAMMKLRAKRREGVERARGSVLKNVWEEHQHREW